MRLVAEFARNSASCCRRGLIRRGGLATSATQPDDEDEKKTMNKNPTVANLLKTIRFERPDWIPASVGFLPSVWLKHGEPLERIVLAHPRLFPHYRAGGFKKMTLPRTHQTGRWKDPWGVTWDNVEPGINAIPVESEAPLRDWAAFAHYQPPDSLKVDDLGNPVDWAQRAKSVAHAKQSGGLATGGMIHGFMYMRLFYLRGFCNFMLDVATREPRLDQLIALVLKHNVSQVEKWLDLGIEFFSGGDDLGMQAALPMSPADWRRYLKPCFAAIFGPCRDRGVLTYLHSDGHILEVIPDLIECGVNVVNPQIRANGLDGLVREAKGKVCICLDLDRQLFPFATPDEIRRHIREAKDALYLPEGRSDSVDAPGAGGLMLSAECAHDVPLANIQAICETLEEVGGGPR